MTHLLRHEKCIEKRNGVYDSLMVELERNKTNTSLGIKHYPLNFWPFPFFLMSQKQSFLPAYINFYDLTAHHSKKLTFLEQLKVRDLRVVSLN